MATIPHSTRTTHMIKRIPARMTLLAIAGVLLIAPVTVLTFLIGGGIAGMIAIAAFAFYFLILYMLTIRWYTSGHR